MLPVSKNHILHHFCQYLAHVHFALLVKNIHFLQIRIMSAMKFLSCSTFISHVDLILQRCIYEYSTQLTAELPEFYLQEVHRSLLQYVRRVAVQRLRRSQNPLHDLDQVFLIVLAHALFVFQVGKEKVPLVFDFRQ